eukprot:TRINITY_DN5220_c0_g1_i4.p1 TRINITY_DN5220_c0_g1~~TRINITY_DN5220_c0_g1_i4.p1  ORF type:complete len:557 (+),score=136.71 TRINITY_DN5220_c0_g1_i4:72-1673(+)
MCIRDSAGIQLWVLTGDKVETAINIGYSCGLLTRGMGKIVLHFDKDDNVETVRTRLEVAEEELSRLSSTMDYALVVTGDALISLDEYHLQDRLIHLAYSCKAVIACRVSPKQKQEIVTLVRNAIPGAPTLAIGDGANDVSMITAAHVGIGIQGLEGQQASRASDYSIGEFKFLKRLLFVYGREAYRRNTHLICYNFYKNMVLVLPQFWFGFINAFSGQTLYDPFLYQFFNLFYASLPIVIYAVFDKEQENEVFESDPSLYALGRDNMLFQTSTFWTWVGVGAYHAFCISYFSYFTFEPDPTTVNMLVNSFWVSGTYAFGLAVWVANLMILLFSNQLACYNVFIIFASVIFYILNSAIVNAIPTLDTFYCITRIFVSPAAYLSAPVLTIVTIGFTLIAQRWLYFSNMSANIIEVPRIPSPRKESHELRLMDEEKVPLPPGNNHRGFFSKGDNTSPATAFFPTGSQTHNTNNLGAILDEVPTIESNMFDKDSKQPIFTKKRQGMTHNFYHPPHDFMVKYKNLLSLSPSPEFVFIR